MLHYSIKQRSFRYFPVLHAGIDLGRLKRMRAVAMSFIVCLCILCKSDTYVQNGVVWCGVQSTISIMLLVLGGIGQ